MSDVTKRRRRPVHGGWLATWSLDASYSWTLRRFGAGQTLQLAHDVVLEVDRLYRLVDLNAPANDCHSGS